MRLFIAFLSGCLLSSPLHGLGSIAWLHVGDDAGTQPMLALSRVLGVWDNWFFSRMHRSGGARKRASPGGRGRGAVAGPGGGGGLEKRRRKGDGTPTPAPGTAAAPGPEPAASQEGGGNGGEDANGHGSGAEFCQEVEEDPAEQPDQQLAVDGMEEHLDVGLDAIPHA
jgi:hypothetical protein